MSDMRLLSQIGCRSNVEQSKHPDCNPSARCFITRDQDTALCCFSCSKLQVVRPILDHKDSRDGATYVIGRYFPPSSRFTTDCGGELWLSGTRQRRTLVAINACVGSGKTEAAADVYRDSSGKTVPVVTCRRPLARQLAQRFDVVCYLDVKTKELS